MMSKLIAAASLALVSLPVIPAIADPSVEGLWEQSDSSGKVSAWFVFEKKSDAGKKSDVYVGRLVKAFPQPGDVKFNTCENCPEIRKGARMMGLTIVYDMKRDGLHYDEGQILDPRNGSMYHAMMDVSEDGQDLSVRGYLMIKALGQTQVWHRLPDDAMKVNDIPKELLAGSVDTQQTSDVSSVAKHPAKAQKHDSKTVARTRRPRPTEVLPAGQNSGVSRRLARHPRAFVRLASHLQRFAAIA